MCMNRTRGKMLSSAPSRLGDLHPSASHRAIEDQLIDHISFLNFGLEDVMNDVPIG